MPSVDVHCLNYFYTLVDPPDKQFITACGILKGEKKSAIDIYVNTFKNCSLAVEFAKITTPS